MLKSQERLVEIAILLYDRFTALDALGIEYDPQPPFNAGSPEKAPPKIVEALRIRSRFLFQNLEGNAGKAESN